MLRRVLLFVLLMACACVVVMPAVAQEARPVIIDTDMTTDDWMAILLTLKNADFSVRAITVTGTGFATCDAGVRAALGLLALNNYSDVPVSCWTEQPLMGDNAPPAEWKTTLETVEALGLPEGGQPAEQNAVELFAATVEASPEPITVLALGPLTNVGAALDAQPELAENIERIYIMGGAVDVAGSGISDENTTAEWNIYCDPHAARLTLESGAPITLVPLDATNDVPVTPDFMTRLEANQTTPESQFIFTALSGSQGSIEAGSYYFWDPLAAAVMADESLVTLTERDVTVVDTPGAENGRTKPVGNGPTIQVATAPDAATFEQWFLDTLNQ